MTDETNVFIASSSENGIKMRKGLNPVGQREQGTMLSPGTHIFGDSTSDGWWSLNLQMGES